MSSSAAQLPSHCGGTCRHWGAVIGCRAPQTLQPKRGLRRPAGGRRRRRGCPDAVHAVVTVSASSVRRTDIRPTGRADVRCPGVRCPGVRCDPGVRTARRPVSAAAAAALSAPRWIPDVGAAGHATVAHGVRRVAAVGERPGRRCPTGTGGEGMVEGWPWVAGTRLDGRSGAASQAHRLRRRARRLADHGSRSSARCRSVGGGVREGAGAPQSPTGGSWAGGGRDARPWGWTGRC
jgi:hypothetical protein